jgi:hypothetical protein
MVRASRARPRASIAALVLGAAVFAAFSCSLLVERASAQCQSDADCARFPNAACDPVTQACVDVSCAANDCVCTPATPTDILNACPRGACSPYDNAGIKALVDGSVPPPPADAGSAPAPSYACMTGAGGGDGGSADAGTIPVCESLTTPLTVLGPTSILPLLGWVAKLYAAQNVTVVFQSDSSCVGVGKSFNKGNMENDPGNEQWTTYFDASGEQHPCKFVSGSVPLDIAVSDVFPQTCGFDINDTDPNVVDTPGPVQAMGFIAPTSSGATSISAEAAYMVLGFGSAASVTPWTDERYVFQRDAASGTQNMIGKALGLSASKFMATTTPDSDTLAALVGCSPAPNATLGILAVDIAESGQYPIKLLAYQHYDQTCGYLPDSQKGVLDKRNVRDGHYFIWGPVHLLTRKDQPNTNATLMTNYVSGISPPPANQPVDIFQIWAAAHLVPQCAMRVTRSSDGGPLAAYKPPSSCSCKYDEATTGTSGCVTCTTSAACPSTAPTCSTYGFCEPS